MFSIDQTTTRRWALVAVAWVCIGASSARGQGVGPTAMVAEPCSNTLDHPFDAGMRPMLIPGARVPPPPPQPAETTLKAMAEQRARDWPNLCRYRAANAALTGSPRAVFMGDSITELWGVADPDFFTQDIVGRGISGQTSPQMLLRFRADVIALHPKMAHILAGTNDIAGNTGPTTEQDFEGNIQSMVELAQTNHVRVLLGSILPMDSLSWMPQYRPAEEVRRLNDWLKAYAARKGATYIDYYDQLATPQGAFRPELSNDGVHPNLAGYRVMREIAMRALGTH